MLPRTANMPVWNEEWGHIFVRQETIGIVVHPDHDGNWLASVNNPHCGCPYHRFKFNTMEEARSWLIDIVERDAGLKVARHHSMGTEVLQAMMEDI